MLHLSAYLSIYKVPYSELFSLGAINDFTNGLTTQGKFILGCCMKFDCGLLLQKLADTIMSRWPIHVTVSAKTVLIGTFSIMRKTDLKYSSCCGSVVLDFISHTRFTI